MNIQNTDNGKKGKFFIEEAGQEIAIMTYVWSGQDKIIIDHTEVSPSLEGKGIGKQLVQKAVDMAREKHIKIMPLCPFANKVFDRTPDYKDVQF